MPNIVTETMTELGIKVGTRRRLVFSVTEQAAIRKASEIAKRARNICADEIPDFELGRADDVLAGIEHGAEAADGMLLAEDWVV